MIAKIKRFCFVTLRIWKYQLLSDCKITGKPLLFHPMLAKGEGKVVFGNKVQMGVVASPGFYSGYCYLEARFSESEITIGNQVSINNSFSAVAFSKITIGDGVLFGVNCSIIDNDGHVLAPDKRKLGIPDAKPVRIEKNVFIGDNVTVLKGVTIGKNSVIGSGSVVTKDIPENVIAAGNPARIIRHL